eukprot:4575034-Pleurochrysis_carterae.AAC.1
MLRHFPNSNVSAGSRNGSPCCGRLRPDCSTSPRQRPGLSTARCSPRLCLSTQSSAESMKPTLRCRRGSSFLEQQKQQIMTTNLIEHSQEGMDHEDMMNLSELMSGATLDPAEWFTDNEQAALLSALRRLLELSGTVPNEIPGTVDDLLDAVPSGLLLARVLLAVDKDALDIRALNDQGPEGSSLDEAAKLQNLTLVINAAAGVGCAVAGMKPTQLLYPRSYKQEVMQQLWTFVKHALLSRISPSSSSELVAHSEDGCKGAATSPEQRMIQWLNQQVRSYLAVHPEDCERVPADFKVENLDADLADGVVLSMVLNQLGATHATSTPRSSTAPPKTHGERALSSIHNVNISIQAVTAQGPVHPANFSHFCRPTSQPGGATASSQQVAQDAGTTQLVSATPSVAPQHSRTSASHLLHQPAPHLMSAPPLIAVTEPRTPADKTAQHQPVRAPQAQLETASRMPHLQSSHTSASTEADATVCHSRDQSTLSKPASTTNTTQLPRPQQKPCDSVDFASSPGQLDHPFPVDTQEQSVSFRQIGLPTTPLIPVSEGGGLSEQFWQAEADARIENFLNEHESVRAHAQQAKPIVPVVPSDISASKPRLVLAIVAQLMETQKLIETQAHVSRYIEDAGDDSSTTPNNKAPKVKS